MAQNFSFVFLFFLFLFSRFAHRYRLESTYVEGFLFSAFCFFSHSKCFQLAFIRFGCAAMRQFREQDDFLPSELTACVCVSSTGAHQFIISMEWHFAEAFRRLEHFAIRRLSFMSRNASHLPKPEKRTSFSPFSLRYRNCLFFSFYVKMIMLII